VLTRSGWDKPLVPFCPSCVYSYDRVFPLILSPLTPLSLCRSVSRGSRGGNPSFASSFPSWSKVFPFLPISLLWTLVITLISDFQVRLFPFVFCWNLRAFYRPTGFLHHNCLLGLAFLAREGPFSFPDLNTRPFRRDVVSLLGNILVPLHHCLTWEYPPPD